eukprot:Protomagalhaensia_sp_Gyna_25__1826@NODE_1966_length_1378_cov_10_544436_g1620_i0_p1_GENE_NODE_1966_length_1378_cov_10_544436_g1620_i0NODE_1966_length_1378_cov_10_544436_g1620_i0_p1_ORF_typecomplete_len428_score75_87zfMYND/PF01753_18/1_6e08_NODE_1966_length_1378_cov_10_544436_g1620_i0701353
MISDLKEAGGLGGVIESRGLRLVTLLHQLVVLGEAASGGYGEFCAEIVGNSRMQASVAVWLVTRCPRVLEYLSAAAITALNQLKDRPARKALSAVWLLAARVLTSAYSLDVRILLCEQKTLVGGLLRAALDPRAFLDSEEETEDGPETAAASKLFKVLDTFSLSPFWVNLLRSELGPPVLAVVQTSIDNYLALYIRDPLRALTLLMEALHTVVLLTVVCEDFCGRVSTDAALADRVLRLVLVLAELKEQEWAALNLLWLAEMNVVGFPEMAAQLGPEDPVQLSLPVLAAGHCLTLLHLIGRSTVGASALAARGAQTLRAIKRLVSLHSETLLKKTGLWPMVVALIPSCSLGVTTSCNDPSLVSVRRLKHYNILLPCTCCSKVAIGSRQLKICGECHLTRYCGRECQQTDWQDGHNTLCRHFVSPPMK